MALWKANFNWQLPRLDPKLECFLSRIIKAIAENIENGPKMALWKAHWQSAQNGIMFVLPHTTYLIPVHISPWA